MSPLTVNDLNFVVRRIPRDIRNLMQGHTLFLGGGFIRETIAGGEVKDIDLFGTSKEVLNELAEKLSTEREGRLHSTDNAITLIAPPRMPVQFITRWCFDRAQPLAESFDFTVCQVVIWHEAGQWHSLAGPGFYSDLAARRLVYTYPKRDEEAGGSIMRVRKFLKRGYNIQPSSLGGVIARLCTKVRWGEIKDDEKKAGEVIAGLLFEVDPLMVVDGLDPIDEHEMHPV